MPRRHKVSDKKHIKPHKKAERILEAASQPVSTQAPDQTPDRSMRAIDEDTPERSEFERTIKDYYAQTDVEGQGGVPRTPPETDPMPLQHIEKPKHPPRHNM